jgi:hypothetical protein
MKKISFLMLIFIFSLSFISCEGIHSDMPLNIRLEDYYNDNLDNRYMQVNVVIDSSFEDTNIYEENQIRIFPSTHTEYISIIDYKELFISKFYSDYPDGYLGTLNTIYLEEDGKILKLMIAGAGFVVSENEVTDVEETQTKSIPETLFDKKVYDFTVPLGVPVTVKEAELYTMELTKEQFEENFSKAYSVFVESKAYVYYEEPTYLINVTFYNNCYVLQVTADYNNIGENINQHYSLTITTTFPHTVEKPAYNR